jgi:hypothetical protein
MSLFGHCFPAERVKWRRSWALLPILLAPLCQVGILFVVFWFSETRVQTFRPGSRFWLEINFVAWNLVVMPLVSALTCALSWEQERAAHAWNRLLTQPVPTSHHFIAKLLSHQSLMLYSLAELVVATWIAGLLLHLQPGLLMGSMPMGLGAAFVGYSALATLGVVAAQTWVSSRTQNLWLGLGFAALGTWVAFRLGTGHTWGPLGASLLPWGAAAQVTVVFERWRPLSWPSALLNLLATAALVVGGTLDFHRWRKP